MLLPHEPTAADRLKNVCGHGDDGGGYEGVCDESLSKSNCVRLSKCTSYNAFAFQGEKNIFYKKIYLFKFDIAKISHL